MSRTAAVPADRLAAFHELVTYVEAMSAEEHDHIQDAHVAAIDAGQALASDDPPVERAIDALLASGRYSHDINDPAWGAMESLLSAIGVAADVAAAVLGRDLISGEDYQAITGWWRAQGLTVPGETL